MIKIKNIYYMLAYAYRTLASKEICEYETEEFEYIEDLFSLVLANGIYHQIKLGIGRSYIVKKELLSAPKGKIIVSELMKRSIKHSSDIVCCLNDLSVNTILNQILKSTILLLLKSAQVKQKNKKKLKKCLIYFSTVDVIDLNCVNWNNLQYTRNNNSYKLLINICYLISKGKIISESHGNLRIKKFTDEQQLYTLFEHFIYEYLKINYPKLNISRPHIPWNSDDGIIDLLPTMRTDAVISYNNHALIIDAKFYSSSLTKNARFGNMTINSANLYQIYTYVKNYSAVPKKNVSGLLLYANTDEKNPNMTYRLDGNEIKVKSLDLDCEFSLVEEQLHDIVDAWLNSIN